MAVKIAHARISEKGTVEGIAGDQTTHEVEVSDWYSGGWLAVYRPNSALDAAMIAGAAEDCARNDHIGYSQDDRLSLYRRASKTAYDIMAINDDCNTDCSAMVAVCVNAAGIIVSCEMTTRNEDAVLMGTGRFTRLNSAIYLHESDYLKRGDILRKSGHTAIVVSDGVNAAAQAVNHTRIYADYKDKALWGKWRAVTDAYMREGASITYRAMTVIIEDAPVYCYGYYSIDDRGVKWLYAEHASNGIKYTGFISEKCLQRVGDI